MPILLVGGRGGSGKSTLVALLARRLGEKRKVLVVDSDESNLGLGAMLGVEPPGKTLMDYLGGKPVVREKLMAMLKGEGSERVELFTEKLALDGLPSECVRWDGSLAFMQVGKIEHSMEGCACPMGAVARAFLNHLVTGDEQWVIVDTEAGVEHFGRGVLEGVDAVLMVVDPSHESVILGEKAARLAREAKKDFGVVLNKVDEKTEPVLREMLAAKGIAAIGVLPYFPAIAQASLLGCLLEAGAMREEVDDLVSGIEGMLGRN
ncbi:MAG: nitrogenase reductase [Bacillota bacterium]|nr:nitrogenase reductase [Bacillota bacterium]